MVSDIMLPGDENIAGSHDNTIGDWSLVSAHLTQTTLVNDIPYYDIIILWWGEIPYDIIISSLLYKECHQVVGAFEFNDQYSGPWTM